MTSDRVKIDNMASAVMESLTEYADLAADEMKKAVQTAGSSSGTWPRTPKRRTGKSLSAYRSG